MCGICGIAHPHRDHKPDNDLLERMTQSLAHRGPDESGTVLTPHVSLGHRRLSVIDLATGQQPMEEPERNLLLSYNGEIYNFRDLRKELIAEGIPFRTDSDTEVLLLGFAHWGMARLLQKIVGMYAFALWDGREHRLYLVRDRLGVKPLYWCTDADGTLYFASELRALRLTPAVEDSLNDTAAFHYFNLGYVVGQEAIIQGVHQLAPGTCLTWQPGAPPRVEDYWNLAEVWTQRQEGTSRPEQEYYEEFSALLQQTIGERLLSEVPLGAFLSGGLDSSLICAGIRQQQTSLKTFSMGFEERSYSELPWATLVANDLGTDHQEAIVACEDPDLLLQVASHLDEPFADTSILPTWVLCREARTHLTVALSGDGGDELLAGYTTHAADKLHGVARHLPRPALTMANALIQGLPDSRAKVGTLFKLKQFLAGAHRDACDAHASWRMLQSRDNLRALILPEAWDDTFDAFAPFREVYDQVPHLNPLDRMLYVDYKTWLANDILVKVDRASMAHGLEVRSPFLDHRLVEFCAGMPPALKLRGFRGKHIMRKVAEGHVPDAVIRRKKAGFNSPVSHWIAGPWRDLVQDTLLGHDAPALLQKERTRALIDEHMAGKRDHGFRLFALLMFALWQTNGTAPRNSVAK